MNTHVLTNLFRRVFHQPAPKRPRERVRLTAVVRSDSGIILRAGTMGEVVERANGHIKIKFPGCLPLFRLPAGSGLVAEVGDDAR